MSNPTIIDIANLSESCFDHMNTLFTAIKGAAPKHSPAHELAEIGQYLAEHYSGLVDDNLEELKRAMP